MQLKALSVGLAALMLASPAWAQSVTPLRTKGFTPSDMKAFWVTVGNPYRRPMTFTITAMNPGFATPAKSVMVQPGQARIAAGGTRRVLLVFKISPPQRERTVALCVSPAKQIGPVIPRVCGTYIGIAAGSTGS